MKLSKQQQDQLRGVDGPYSETKLVIEDRIIDDGVSRKFVEVLCNVNPLSFEIAKQNIDKFDSSIQGLLGAAQYQDQKHGYMVSNFLVQIPNDDINTISQLLPQALVAKESLRNDIITIHKFVIELLGL